MYNVKLVDYHYEEKYSVTINTVIGYKLFQIVWLLFKTQHVQKNLFSILPEL